MLEERLCAPPHGLDPHIQTHHQTLDCKLNKIYPHTHWYKEAYCPQAAFVNVELSQGILKPS